ncbi:MAG: hypothetical protein KF850_18510 [Labilithrix sp.]|nr:hypothetical protein [Labilithrix sp.]MBX3224828.1 hypothetical protein [Labilithrix sp.]
MIEIRLRAAASNPSARPWRWGVSLAALALCVVAPVATSRAQDAGRATRDLESLRALERVTIDGGRTVHIDGGESITIASGAASITMKKDGTIVIKGTEIVIDGENKATASPPSPRVPDGRRAAQMSEIF